MIGTTEFRRFVDVALVPSRTVGASPSLRGTAVFDSVLSAAQTRQLHQEGVGMFPGGRGGNGTIIAAPAFATETPTADRRMWLFKYDPNASVGTGAEGRQASRKVAWLTGEFQGGTG